MGTAGNPEASQTRMFLAAGLPAQAAILEALSPIDSKNAADAAADAAAYAAVDAAYAAAYAGEISDPYQWLRLSLSSPSVEMISMVIRAICLGFIGCPKLMTHFVVLSVRLTWGTVQNPKR